MRALYLLIPLCGCSIFSESFVSNVCTDGLIAGFEDRDGDGVGSENAGRFCLGRDSGWSELTGDCDDTNPSVHEGAVERCSDTGDYDCDGMPRSPEQIDEAHYQDLDGDGHGGLFVSGCLEDGLVADGLDCDDGSIAINPDAVEVCDGMDNDCDGLIDDEDASRVADQSWYPDDDGDGHGDPSRGYASCAPIGTDTALGDDCDDSQPFAAPGELEVCDGIDNDCDGSTDDGDDEVRDGLRWYLDWDGDGFGDDAVSETGCAAPAGMVAVAGDCDDGDASVNPDGAEVCGGGDEDCDGWTDDDDGSVSGRSSFYRDADGDGSGGMASVQRCSAPPGYVNDAADCDDTDSAVNPSAREVCNTIDDDCDGLIDDYDSVAGTTLWYVDVDGDGYGDLTTAYSACLGGGGVANGDDCDDGAFSVHPAAIETCDSLDNDCDDATDELDADCLDRFLVFDDADGDAFGDPSSSSFACELSSAVVLDASDCDPGDGAVNPGAMERCDGIDNDCDAAIDADDASAIDLVRQWTDSDGDGHGDASAPADTCGGAVGYADDAEDCDDGDVAVGPSALEVCDGVDQTCEGDIDEGCADIDGDGFADGSVDKLVADGSALCWHQDLIGWSTGGGVWAVGYGFGGGSGWTDLTHAATRDGDFWCFDFAATGDSVYRTNLWSGSGSGAYTSWAYMGLYCGAYADPLCYERTDGISACFILRSGVIEATTTAICDAT